MLWIIENRPDSELAGNGYGGFLEPWDVTYHTTGDAIWLRIIDRHCNSAKILANAAGYFFEHRPELSEMLYKQLQALEPHNAKWHERLAFLYHIKEHDPIQQLAEAESAVRLSKRGGLLRARRLVDAAEAALRAHKETTARRYLSQVFTAVREVEDVMRFDLCHNAHTLLGLIAVRTKDLESARQELMQSAETAGPSPVLATFGPRMDLAEQLFAEGQKQAVLDYLISCQRFWVSGEKTLKKWIGQIKRGKQPHFTKGLETG